ncbi:DIS3 mitotic control, partial [Cichlidogyrus casuarinus]
HYVRSLGPVGDLDTETQTILHEYNLGVRAFTQTILDELSPLSQVRPWRADPEECLKRRDLRSPSDPGVQAGRGEDFLIFSIDPPSCEDVDDALSVRMLGNGRIQLGVHIADVTHFVKPGSFVDLEARRRTTSVYMADRRFDMLPGILSGDICSLWSGRDRYAVSVIWELDASTCEVLDVWYGRTVIRSRYKMAYENAEKIHNQFQKCTAAKKLVDALGGIPAIHQMMPELKNSSTECNL